MLTSPPMKIQILRNMFCIQITAAVNARGMMILGRGDLPACWALDHSTEIGIEVATAIALAAFARIASIAFSKSCFLDTFSERMRALFYMRRNGARMSEMPTQEKWPAALLKKGLDGVIIVPSAPVKLCHVCNAGWKLDRHVR